MCPDPWQPRQELASEAFLHHIVPQISRPGSYIAVNVALNGRFPGRGSQPHKQGPCSLTDQFCMEEAPGMGGAQLGRRDESHPG